MKPILYIMCGPAGCGKSTFANEFMQKLSATGIDKRICISRDAIRFSLLKDGEDYFAHEDEVFANFIHAITSQLKDGVCVIADATHLNMGSRKKLTYAIDQEISDYDIVYIVFDTPLDVCLKRNSFRLGRQCVPDETIKEMHKYFRIPREDEDPRMIGMITVKGDTI